MYKHLSREERYQIHSLLKANQTISEIARLLGRHRSTISRELSRGRGQSGYRAEQACGKASERSKHSRKARRVDATVWSDVAFYLPLQWIPEQLADKVGVTYECLYLHVYANQAAGGDLHKNLRSQKPLRIRHLCARDRRGQIPNRRSISERPSHIEAKLKPLRSRVKTLIVDNGTEFADHQAVEQTLGIQTYFADPYCSWQLGSNENFNGLPCQDLPKNRRIQTVTEEELTMIENRLNHRPRKRLGFKTPYEVFHASLNHFEPRT